ncbi:MAG: FmdB family zinc ribbon protein [Anaerolineae bacterium]
MPIYDYVCSQCGKRFDKLVKLSMDVEQTAVTECPVCGAPAHKVVSPFRIANGSASSSGFDDEPASAATPNVTPKEDIERWRKESKKK